MPLKELSKDFRDKNRGHVPRDKHTGSKQKLKTANHEWADDAVDIR